VTSYRFRRRSFLASLGGAFGLSTLLSNLEASAEGQASPPRFLLMFWPVGTVPSAFRPIGEGSAYQTSPILQPFEDAGLRQDAIVLFGLSDNGIKLVGGGGSEGGVVVRTTGAPSPGTRVNGGEGDDSVAGGPSFDQIFLKHVPLLSRPDSPVAFLNAIGDARVDSQETSAQCLSYAYQTRSVAAFQGGTIVENIPLLPELSPAKLYAKVFAGFMPGGNSSANQREALRALQLRKSVLDYALGELARVKRLAPASEAPRIDLHAEAIRKLEQQLSDQLDGGVGPACVVPAEPDQDIVAPTGSMSNYNDPTELIDESVQLEVLGKLHLGVIRAAFQCDLTRVATFQWTSSVDKVSFKGLFPGEPDTCYRHHPLSHRVSAGIDPPPSPDSSNGKVIQFLANVHTWFNQKTADALKTFKETQDVFGNALLDHTIVPFVTDTANTTHMRSPLPTLIFGGRALGMQGGQYQNFEKALRPHNDVWLSIAQAYMPDAPDVLQTLGGETFALNTSGRTGPIAGLWQRPT
jgi:hypothetical protein